MTEEYEKEDMNLEGTRARTCDMGLNQGGGNQQFLNNVRFQLRHTCYQPRGVGWGWGGGGGWVGLGGGGGWVGLGWGGGGGLGWVGAMKY